MARAKAAEVGFGRSVIGIAAATVALASAGCATRADLEQVRQNQAQARRVIAEQSVAIEDLRRRFEMLRAAAEETAPGARDDPGWRAGIESRLAAIERRAVVELPAEVEAPPVAGLAPISPGGVALPQTAPPAAMPAAAAPAGDLAAALAREDEVLRGPQVDPEYRAAIEMIRGGRCAEAVPQLQGIVRKNIRSPFADKAQYWIGRCYQLQGDHNRAVRELYDVILKFPQSDRVPAALLVLADAFTAAGDDIDARLALRKVVAEHPNSAEAETARQRLRALGE